MVASRTIFAVLSLALQSCAVTIETSIPTSDANYMVLQGDWNYLDSGPASFGALNGRVQIVRSALVSETTFSYIVHFSDSALAPAVGTTLTASFARRICSVIDSAATTPTLYQDPYECPAYDFSTDTNGCDSNQVASNPLLEVQIGCTVAQSGGSSFCEGTYTWDVYIPPIEGDQNVEDTSLVIGVAGSELFACANFDTKRDLVPSTATTVGGPTLVSGHLEKDELGYTHLDLSVDTSDANADYGFFVSQSPCTTTTNAFAEHVAIGVLSGTSTADSAGILSIEHYAPNVIGAATMSVVLTSSSTFVTCFDLETFVFPGTSRNGQVAGGGTNGGTNTGGADGYGGSSSDVGNGCALWEHYYTSDDDGSGKGKGKKQKKFKGGRDHFDQFASYSINSQARCCLSHSYDVSESQDGTRTTQKGKGKASSLLSMTAGKATATRTGLWAGLTGVVVLAAGVAMHVHRKRSSSMQQPIPMSTLDETTPLTMGGH